MRIAQRAGAIMVSVLLIASTRAQPAKPALGIVWYDGRIVPVAAFDGDRWERAWPGIVQDDDSA